MDQHQPIRGEETKTGNQTGLLISGEGTTEDSDSLTNCSRMEQAN